MDAAPAVSTLHTQGSKAWAGCTKDQEKEREYGAERQTDHRETGEKDRREGKKKRGRVKKESEGQRVEVVAAKVTLCVRAYVCVCLCVRERERVANC